MTLRTWTCPEHGQYVQRIPLCNRCEVVRQRQDSLDEQLRDVRKVAERMGCYDAVDWIRTRTL